MILELAIDLEIFFETFNVWYSGSALQIKCTKYEIDNCGIFVFDLAET
jgi:hypothetical protein